MSKPNINVTPLIDVLLVLLIIFMVVSPLKPYSFEARLPQEPRSETMPPDTNPLAIVLTIGRDSRIILNREDLDATVESPRAVIDRLNEVFRRRAENFETERTVFIKAPKGLNYGSIIKVVDAAKMDGARPISLQIDKLD